MIEPILGIALTGIFWAAALAIIGLVAKLAWYALTWGWGLL